MRIRWLYILVQQEKRFDFQRIQVAKKKGIRFRLCCGVGASAKGIEEKVIAAAKAEAVF
ncbi:MAG: hypothetical protein K6F32_00970 [Bacilli bacterium]|nr:hypothetical protein [Bacilli bacterium]